jgi:hypothetical protein
MDIATSCLFKQGTQLPTIGEVEVGLEHALELQETADLDPGIWSGDQYMYPILILRLKKTNIFGILIAPRLPDRPRRLVLVHRQTADD